jgi:hypothetical protein
MARKAGQLFSRGPRTALVRISLGLGSILKRDRHGLCTVHEGRSNTLEINF